MAFNGHVSCSHQPDLAPDTLPMSNRWSGFNLLALMMFFVAICPGFITGALIVSNWVNVPIVDEWDLFPLYQQFAEGSLGFATLFAQVNEYRQFFPNTIFVTVAWLTNGDVRYLMVLTFIFACLISFNVYHLGKLTLPPDHTVRLVTFFLSNLIIFSPVQHENWIQGQQLIYFVPIACLTAALLICFSEMRPGAKFLICGALSTVATFSSANGIVCWIVLLPVLLLSADDDQRWRKFLTLFWLTGLASNIAAYLYQYQQVRKHPSVMSILTEPLLTASFFLGLFGRPLSLGPVGIAIGIGFVLLAAFVVFGWQLLRFRTTATLNRNTMCWLMVGAYSILTAILITAGRVGFGLAQVRGATRYTTFTLYLIVALLHLMAIRFASSKKVTGSWLSSAGAHTVLACAFILLQVGHYIFGVTRLNNFRTLLLESKACVLLTNVMSEECLSPFARWTPNMKEESYLADSLGMLNPGMLKQSDFREHQVTSNTPGEFGKFETLQYVGADTYIATGSAFLPARNASPAAIVIAYERPGGPAKFLSPSAMNLNSDWVSALRGTGTYRDSGWSRTFVLASSDQGETKVSAWAVDISSSKLYKLSGTHVLSERPTSH